MFNLKCARSNYSAVKDQRSAHVVRRLLADLGKKINSDLRVYKQELQENCRRHQSSRGQTHKPQLINQQCVVCKFSNVIRCVMQIYVGYTRRHLFQRIEEHTVNTNTLLLENTCVTPTIRETKIFRNNSPFLKKCRDEMLFIQEMKPELNTQSDSVKANLFST